ncbi:unnamed protein product, partial [Brassica napus]
ATAVFKYRPQRSRSQRVESRLAAHAASPSARLLIRGPLPCRAYGPIV